MTRDHIPGRQEQRRERIPRRREKEIRDAWVHGRRAEAKRLQGEDQRKETSPGTFGPIKKGCRKEALSVIILTLVGVYILGQLLIKTIIESREVYDAFQRTTSRR